jgi:hypothetical protein
LPSQPQTGSSGRVAQLPFAGFMTHVPAPPAHDPAGSAQISPLPHVPFEQAAPLSAVASLASASDVGASTSAVVPSPSAAASPDPSAEPESSGAESRVEESLVVDVSAPELASLAETSSEEEAQPSAMAVHVATDRR